MLLDVGSRRKSTAFRKAPLVVQPLAIVVVGRRSLWMLHVAAPSTAIGTVQFSSFFCAAFGLLHAREHWRRRNCTICGISTAILSSARR